MASNGGEDPDSPPILFLQDPLKQRKLSSWNPGRSPPATKKAPFLCASNTQFQLPRAVVYDSFTVPMGGLKLLTLKFAGLEELSQDCFFRVNEKSTEPFVRTDPGSKPRHHLSVMHLGLCIRHLSASISLCDNGYNIDLLGPHEDSNETSPVSCLSTERGRE